MQSFIDQAVDQAVLFPENLPDHQGQLTRYTAAGLTPSEARSLEERAARIITIGRRAILDIGIELLAARKEAQYGTWSIFLGRAGLSESTARNYINVAERFADKPAIIADLPLPTIYALAAPSADPVVVAAIIEEVQHGTRPSTQEVRERTQSAKPAPKPCAACGKPSVRAIDGGMLLCEKCASGYERAKAEPFTPAAPPRCIHCDTPATTTVAGTPFCRKCAEPPVTVPAFFMLQSGIRQLGDGYDLRWNAKLVEYEIVIPGRSHINTSSIKAVEEWMRDPTLGKMLYLPPTATPPIVTPVTPPLPADLAADWAWHQQGKGGAWRLMEKQGGPVLWATAWHTEPEQAIAEVRARLAPKTPAPVAAEPQEPEIDEHEYDRITDHTIGIESDMSLGNRAGAIAHASKLLLLLLEIDRVTLTRETQALIAEGLYEFAPNADLVLRTLAE